jgi:hypothetical protein
MHDDAAMFGRRALRSWRHTRARKRLVGEAALTDRQVLLRVGAALMAGKAQLDEVAEAMEVPEPALAVALERVFGVVPAPPAHSA